MEDGSWRAHRPDVAHERASPVDEVDDLADDRVGNEARRFDGRLMRSGSLVNSTEAAQAVPSFGIALLVQEVEEEVTDGASTRRLALRWLG